MFGSDIRVIGTYTRLFFNGNAVKGVTFDKFGDPPVML
jgi:hypothetical protein